MQIRSLCKLYNQYHKHGLEVLAFLCSEFHEEEDDIREMNMKYTSLYRRVWKGKKAHNLRRRW